MDATCDFQEKKKGREEPQVMHIRLCIYHIFLSWSVSKLKCNLASLCMRVSVCETAYIFIHVKFHGVVLCCQAFSKLGLKCVSKGVLKSDGFLCTHKA